MGSPKSLLAALACISIAAPALAGNLYCCQETNSSRRVCGDTVPDQCKGRGYKIFNNLGTQIGEVGPPLTPEQRAQQAAEAKRQKEIEEAQREQRRKDAALVETYTDLDDIDRLRERAEADIIKSMQTAEERIAEAQQRRKKFENEAEFYKNKTVPNEVVRGLKEADNEIDAQRSLVANKKKELAETRAHYEADKKRYRELTSSHPVSRTVTPAPTPAAAPSPRGGSLR